MEDIKKILPGIKENVSMAEYTTFKIGGKAKYFFVAKSPEQLVKSVKIAKQLKLPFFIIGEGSNLLVSDKGYKGLIIKIEDRNVKLKNNCVSAGAGASLRAIVKLATEKCLKGLEWAGGIPGSVGGAVYGNVGAFGSTISNSIEIVSALDVKNLKIKKFSNQGCKFNNKDSIFKKNKNLIILSVVLKLKVGDKDEIASKVKRLADHRRENYPLRFPSAGCIFKNYTKKITDKNLLKKYPELNEFNKGSRIPTSYLIDRAGLKGKIIGGAQISEKHANFIINIGRAKSKDVLKLIKLIKEKVKNKFKIKLEEEVQYIG